MGKIICNIIDEMGQSALEQQKWDTVWRGEEQLCNKEEEIDGGGESVEILIVNYSNHVHHEHVNCPLVN